MQLPNPPIFGDIGFSNNTSVWLVGGPLGNQFYLTHDGGKHWNIQSIARPAGVQDATQMDFRLTGKYAANIQKKHTHMVYVPAETGSNLSGHWVEVDDNVGAAAVTSGNVKKLSGEAVRKMQGGGSNSGGN